MVTGRLGKVYKDGETIINQGLTGENFYVIQAGRVEVVQSTEQGEQHLIYLDTGESFGEMAIFEKEVRSATIRAVGEARVLKIDKKTLYRRIQEDPILAVNLMRKMAQRIRQLSAKLAALEADTR